jgi:hypothetical protein
LRSGLNGSDQAAIFYADEFNATKTAGLLTPLSLTRSRDGEKKVYVQDRMREVGRELWTWLAEGANLYIAATPSAWRRMSSGRRSISSRNSVRARGHRLRRGTQAEGPVPAGCLLRKRFGSNSRQIRGNKILKPRGCEEFFTSARLNRTLRITVCGAALQGPQNRI